MINLTSSDLKLDKEIVISKINAELSNKIKEKGFL